MHRRFIFFDIDGTLAVGTPGNQYVPDSAREAVRRLEAAGHFVAIATGRSHVMAVDTMHELGFHNMVSDGGYGVTVDDELLGITPLPREEVIALIDECREKDFIWGIQVDDSKTRLVPDGRFMDFTHDIYMGTRVVPGLEPRDYPDLYKAYVACLAPREQELDALRRLPWCRFHKEFLFIEPADKAFGIKKIVDRFGGDYADVVVFGDEKNDYSMFLPEWTCVAMGNAIPGLKERATYVTADAADDGIYKACEHLGLFEPVDGARGSAGR